MRVSRLRSAAAALLSVLAAGLVFASSPSLAFEGYGLAHQFGQPGSGAGQFSNPGWVAVEESSGDVYVVDAGNNRVEKFDPEGKYLSEFGGGETPAGAFSSPWEIAVDNTADAAKGNVYVGDVGNNAVDIFDSSGKYLSQITGTPSETFSDLEGVAIGPAGQLWIHDGGNVDRFTDTGTFVSEFATGRESRRALAVDSADNIYLLRRAFGQIGKYSEVGEVLVEEFSEGFTALAIDPATNELFADAGGSLVKFGPLGEPLATFGEGTLGESQGVAVNGAAGLIYATSGVTDKIYVFKNGVFPDVSTAGASEVQQTTATLHGTVNADGKPTTYHFEYGTTTAYGTATPTASAGEETAEVPVSFGLTALQFGTTYHYRLVAENENGASFGADAEFTTAPAAPIIDQPGSATNITRSGAKLSAAINPGGGQTTSYFEYGTSEAYGLTTSQTTSTGIIEGEVTSILTELSPQTKYHFRIVSTNATATVRGPDQTFTSGTLTPPLAATVGARDVRQGSATIAATVDDEGLSSTYAFRVATTPDDLGPPMGLGALAFGAGEQAVAVMLTGLQPATTYYYRALATNVDGTSEGATLSFTTSAVPATLVLPPPSAPRAVALGAKPRPKKHKHAKHHARRGAKRHRHRTGEGLVPR